MRAIPLVLCAFVLAACGGPLAEGEAEFDKGRYPEAKQTFAELEAVSHGWSDTKRAEYALYRGLTLNALGDRGQASVRLLEAKAIEDAHPGSLTPKQAQRLRLGIESSD